MEKAPAVQLQFALRTSPNVRSVHLLGSWDGYKRQLPLSMIKDSDAKPGSWRGTFRFQGSQALKLGCRYWYYYIIDGYHVSHDPAKESVVEPTTGRKLNVLNVPDPPRKSPKEPAKAFKQGLSIQTQNLPSKRHSREIVHGRSLSPTRILCPRPQKPYASRRLREADYEVSPIDDLEERFAASRLSDRLSDRSRPYSSSPSDLSDCSSSGAIFSSPGSTVSSNSSHSSFPRDCHCGRFGVTRDGQRIKLDCGGSKCGYASTSPSCASTSEDSESEEERLPSRRKISVPIYTSERTANFNRRPLIVERRP